MEILDLSNIELFKSLLEFQIGDNYIDLHNNFDLKTFRFDNKNLELVFKNIKTDLELIFCFLNTEFLDFEIIKNEDLTIDNFYRGRYFLDEKLYDIFDNKKCFYLEFIDDTRLNLLSEKLFVKYNKGFL